MPETNRQHNVTTYEQSFFTPSSNLLIPEKPRVSDLSWIFEYESKKDSIFKYYNVENEVSFLNKTKAKTTREEQDYYMRENIKKFLKEFVDHTLYTSIPYTLKPDGFDYAGIHVMESYIKAASEGGEREKAETAGFGEIETRFINNTIQQSQPEWAFWTSPPKDANYGFHFVCIPQKDGHVEERIIRYEEQNQNGIVEPNSMSAAISQIVNPHTLPFTLTNDYLTHPQFVPADTAGAVFEDILRKVGVSQKELAESEQFDSAVEGLLSGWIQNYIETIHEISSNPGNNNAELFLQAKATLIEIYRHAQQIKFEIKSVYGHGETTTSSPAYTPYSQSDLYAAYGYAYINQAQPTVVGGGSCPVVETKSDSPSRQQQLYNNEVHEALTNGKKPESLLEKKDYKDDPNLCRCGGKEPHFHCPGKLKSGEACNHAIIVGKGTTACPHCGQGKTC